MKIISVGTQSIYDGSNYPLVIFFELSDSCYYELVNGYYEFQNLDEVYDHLLIVCENRWNTELLSQHLILDYKFKEVTQNLDLLIIK
jgi:hypothetical protein